MTVIYNTEDVLLTVVPLLSLSMLCLLCLTCKRKPKIIQEDSPLYYPEIFQRGGSRFAVTRSKTVTRPNQITSCEQQSPSQEDVEVSHSHTSQDSFEPTYVAPLPNLVYENVRDMTEMAAVTFEASVASTVSNTMIALNSNQTGAELCDYENVSTSFPINDDDDDYENSDFLRNGKDQQIIDDQDYVNV